MSDIERIAAGLSEAQRNALLYYPFCYMDPNTHRSLKRRGLVGNMRLTDTGLAVRAHLENSDAG